MVLADRMMREDGGTLAVVLPTVMATNPAASDTRKYLAERFHIDTIVSSHDPARIFLSENTSIGEVLLVCRRWRGGGLKPTTRVVNLARNPETPLEALDTAGRIEQAGERGDQVSHDFTVQQVDSDRIERGDWFAVNFLSPFLVEAYRDANGSESGDGPDRAIERPGQSRPCGTTDTRFAYTQVRTCQVSRGDGRSGITRPISLSRCWAETDVYIEPKAPKRHSGRPLLGAAQRNVVAS